MPLQNRGEREFPFPIIPGNTGLQFPSRNLGREFSTRIPVPEIGNGIFHLHSRSRNWEWNFLVNSREFLGYMHFCTKSKKDFAPVTLVFEDGK